MSGSNLLHVAQDVLPAVKHASALLSVQLVDKVSGEVLVAVLISGTDGRTEMSMRTQNLQSSFSLETQKLQTRGAASPQHQTSLDAGLHLLQQMLHVGLNEKKKMMMSHLLLIYHIT